MSMNRIRLESAIHEKTGVAKNDVHEVLSAAFDIIAQSLKEETDVRIIGFGTFSVRDREERVGKNPKTGEAINIPASKKAVFKAGRALNDILN